MRPVFVTLLTVLALNGCHQGSLRASVPSHLVVVNTPLCSPEPEPEPFSTIPALPGASLPLIN